MKKKLSILIALVMAISLCLTPAVASANPGAPIIDGVIGVDEWGTPLCTTTGAAWGYPGDQSITVYAYVTVDALYLAFDTSDMTDNRVGGSLDVLDWNIGLVGSDFAPPSYPWRYVLVTKVSPDTSWGDSWDAIDGYHGSWGDTWNIPVSYYSHIPEGIEMVTKFAPNRVTEFKVPMSVMFDGEHGWDGPNAGDVLLLGGCYTGEDAEGSFEQLWWPTGIDHGNAGTYATYTLPPNTTVGLTADVEDIVAIDVTPTSIDFGILKPGQTSGACDITVANIGTHTIDVDAKVYEAGLFYDNLELKCGENWNLWSYWGNVIDNLAMDDSETIYTRLPVPSGFTPGGEETATLLFLATPVSP